MPLYALDGISPDLGEGTYVAPTAVLIGRVRLARHASVWWNAVLRGDNEWIEIGEGANVQDAVVCHTDMGAPLLVGAGATVGHAAILHGCRVGAGSLIGMGAKVLNHAVIGEGSLIGAGALVPEGKTIPPRVLAVGTPAKVVRELRDDDVARIAKGSDGYVANAARYRAGCVPIG